jgi:hypothetical protein
MALSLALVALSLVLGVVWGAVENPRLRPHGIAGGGRVSQGQDEYVYLESEAIKVGLDMSRGGSIGFASAVHQGENVINTADMGREIQLSFYGGPDDYDNCHWNGQNWPWNPIGAGDVKGHHGTVLSLEHNATFAHIITRPLQWACDNVPCECTFEQTMSLSGTVLHVTSTLHNNRSDHTPYPAHPQELPAAYSIGTLYKVRPRSSQSAGSRVFG